MDMSVSEKKKSKPRLSVDMTDSKLKNAVAVIKEKLHVSGSKAIEILALEGWSSFSNKLESYVDDDALIPDDYDLKSFEKASAKLSLNLIETFRMESLNGKNVTIRQCQDVKPVPLLPLRIKKWVSADDIYSLTKKKVDYVLIKKIINLYFYPADNLHHRFMTLPDAGFFFVTRIDISFKDDVTEDELCKDFIGESAIYLDATVNVVYIPIYKTQSISKIVRCLDFDNVKYNTFRTVATKGWSHRKYSHYFHIEDINLHRGGGYFIGSTRSACDSHFDKEHGYTVPDQLTLMNMVTERRKLENIWPQPFKLFDSGASIKITSSGMKRLREKIIENKKRSFNSQKS